VQVQLFDHYFVRPAEAKKKRDALNAKVADAKKSPLRKPLAVHMPFALLTIYLRSLKLPSAALQVVESTFRRGFKSYSAHHIFSRACRGINAESPTHNLTHNPPRALGARQGCLASSI
jgi:hypothetical protein